MLACLQNGHFLNGEINVVKPFSLPSIKNRFLWLTLAILALIGGYWFWTKSNTSTSVDVPLNKPTQIPSSETAALNPNKVSLPTNSASTAPEKVKNEATPSTPAPAQTAPASQIPLPPPSPSPSSQLDSSWKSATVKKGDSLARCFKRQGISAQELHRLEQSCDKKTLKQLQQLRVGQKMDFLVKDKQLQAFHLHLANRQILKMARQANGQFLANADTPSYQKQLAYRSSTVKDSLFVSAKKAGLSHQLISQMVDILGHDIDFGLDIRNNDHFHVLFEENYLDGQKTSVGEILAVEFINRGKKYQAVRFTDAKGRSGYFSPEGTALNKAFLRTPVEFSRISSHFGSRKHPVLHHMRVHKGVDYAAPIGTPVKAVADAKVVFAGTKGGYGKTIELKHNTMHTTLYAHLSKFAQVKAGSSVKKGQVIGYVGKTGLASGPHLHFEFRVNGVHQNPLTVALPKLQAIPEADKKAFDSHAKKMIALLQARKNTALARNEFYLPGSVIQD